MYSTGCRWWGQTTGTITLKQNGNVIDSITDVSDYTYIDIHSWWLNSGTYQVEVQIKWGDTEVKDYTVSVYTNEKVKITDAKGKPNELGGHDITTYATSAKKKKSSKNMQLANGLL